MSTENLLIELYQEQVDFLQKQIQKLKNHTGQTGQAPATEKKAKADGKKEKRKRSPSAYQVFMQEKLKQSHGEHNSGDDAKSIMTRVSKLWNELDEAAKQPYVKRAAELKTAMEANAAANGAPAPVVVKTDVAKPSSSSAEQKPKESKKRKQPEPAAAEPVVAKPAAPVAAPATPAPAVPPTPTTAGEETAKKKKKKDKDPSNTDKKKKKSKEEKGN